MECFNWKKNAAKLVAGFKGGPFFQGLVKPPERSFVAGYPKSVDEMQMVKTPATGKIVDTWVQRRPNSSMK